MSGRGGKRKQKLISRSARAGVLFPVARMLRYLKKDPRHLRHRIGAGSPVYMAAVIEYLVAEILELAGNAAKEFKRGRITPRHILLAIANDEELHQLLRHVTIAQGGVVPRINQFLFGNSTKGGKKTNGPTIPVPKSTLKAATKLAAKKLKAATAASPSKTPTTFDWGKPKKADSIPNPSGGFLTLSEKKLAQGQKLTVMQGDLVKVNADAIVHPSDLSYSFGGQVGSAIQKAGGKELTQEVDKLRRDQGSIANAGAAICPGHNFPAKFVIHVNSPTWSETNAQRNLDKAVKNVLRVADEKLLKSIALPSISSGNAGFPKQTAAQIILRSIRDYFASTKTSSLKQVFFVLYDPESVTVYTTELARLDG